MVGMTNASLTSIDSFATKLINYQVVEIDKDDYVDKDGNPVTAVGEHLPPFTQEIVFTSSDYLYGLVETASPIITREPTAAALAGTEDDSPYEKAYNCITAIITGNSKITVKCLKRLPEHNTFIKVKGII